MGKKARRKRRGAVEAKKVRKGGFPFGGFPFGGFRPAKQGWMRLLHRAVDKCCARCRSHHGAPPRARERLILHRRDVEQKRARRTRSPRNSRGVMIGG